VTHHKRENCDEVVESLDELFPDGISASLARDIYAQDSHRSEGGEFGVSVYDENGNEKNNIEYIRVPGKGSIEAYELDDGSWAVTRRDNLNHNKEDKL
jgi:hypothetical protein